jgi:hypothetical protein
MLQFAEENKGETAVQPSPEPTNKVMNTWQRPVPNNLACVAHKDTNSTARSRHGRLGGNGKEALVLASHLGQARAAHAADKKDQPYLSLLVCLACPHSRRKSPEPKQRTESQLPPLSSGEARCRRPIPLLSAPARMSAWADAALLLASPSPATSSCSLARPRSRRLCKVCSAPRLSTALFRPF